MISIDVCSYETNVGWM